MTEPLTLHGALRVPAILLPTCQPADVEHLLHDAGLLPVEAEARRRRMDPDRPGYVLTFPYTLALTP